MKYPENVVILHQFSRAIRAPSGSPFALKLETWFSFIFLLRNFNLSKSISEGSVD